MKTFTYTKINGAGNDFVLIDKKINPGIDLLNTEIVSICNRESGIGADGVIFIDDSSKFDFNMTYYNADGSTGSLCGNGARCAIKYAQVTSRLKGTSTQFISNDLAYTGEILSENIIKFFLQPVTELKFNFRVKAFGQLIKAHFVDSGSPHIVINVNDILQNPNDLDSVFTIIEKIPILEIGREVRNLPEFKPFGTNVNFIDIKETHIKIRSYERGVEAETLACGTGAVAAAIIASLIYKKNAPIKLITKSNAELIVNFTMGNNEIINISLTGPVEIEHEGKYSI